jgi:hypothetical protein
MNKEKQAVALLERAFDMITDRKLRDEIFDFCKNHYPQPSKVGNGNEVSFHTVGQLRKALDGIPDKQVLFAGIEAQNGHVLPLWAKVVKDVPGGSAIALYHATVKEISHTTHMVYFKKGCTAFDQALYTLLMSQISRLNDKYRSVTKCECGADMSHHCTGYCERDE